MLEGERLDPGDAESDGVIYWLCVRVTEPVPDEVTVVVGVSVDDTDGEAEGIGEREGVCVRVAVGVIDTDRDAERDFDGVGAVDEGRYNRREGDEGERAYSRLEYDDPNLIANSPMLRTATGEPRG